MKKTLVLLLCLCVLLSLCACGGAAERVEKETRLFTDSCGRTVELPVQIDAVVPSGPAHGTARLPCQSTLLSKWAKSIVRLLGPVAGGSAWGPRGGRALSPRAKRWW